MANRPTPQCAFSQERVRCLMLSEIIIRLLVKNSVRPELPPVRLAYGIVSGCVGIAVNLFLFGVKLGIGLFSGSVAIAADALNNLSDSGSSAVTVFGFRLSARPADNEHPFGHGRLEYVAALIVAVIIIAVGMDFLKESVARIFSHKAIAADNFVIAVYGATILVKLWLFFFYRTIGRRIDSQAISAAAFDSLSDMLTTAVVLGALFASRFTALPVDGYAGTLVALFVMYGGVKILRNAMSPLVGECPDRALVEELRARLLQCPDICGVHDIIMHNYGPGQYYATAHAEVNRDGDLLHMHDALEAAEVAIARTMPIRLILHCDPYDAADPVIKLWRARMEEAVSELDAKLKLYDFRLDPQASDTLHFHLLTPRNYALSYEEITARLTARMKRYNPMIQLDIEFLNSFV